MFDWYMYVFWFFVVLATSFVVFDHYKKKRRKKKPYIEFKCLEHMVPLDSWNPVFDEWECPRAMDGCESVVDWETRLKYEGISPPG
jgi:hypothetical protein